jgi:SAM-dependent methyltransferase
MTSSAENDADTRQRLAREIEHHRRIAEHAEAVWNWDSPAGRHRAERRVHLFVERGGLRAGVRALELGCGTGVFLERVAASGARITAIDLSSDLLARARARLAETANVALVRGNAEKMPFPDRSFDAVYGSSILHHLSLDRSLAEVLRLLRPGGLLVFAEPNILNPQVALMFRIGAVKDRFGVSPDEMAFSRFRARAVLERLGFQEVSVVPFDFVHPSLPTSWIAGVARLGRAIEATPVLREIAGSLLITARRPT